MSEFGDLSLRVMMPLMYFGAVSGSCAGGIKLGLSTTTNGVVEVVVPYADCVKLGGNVVSLGNKRVLSMAHNLNVNVRLRDAGFEVTAVEYDMFALGGGGVHCSCHELRRET